MGQTPPGQTSSHRQTPSRQTLPPLVRHLHPLADTPHPPDTTGYGQEAECILLLTLNQSSRKIIRRAIQSDNFDTSNVQGVYWKELNLTMQGISSRISRGLCSDLCGVHPL